jgi:succinate dehydrogenase/fumarate reductase flavoprotein subunit
VLDGVRRRGIAVRTATPVAELLPAGGGRGVAGVVTGEATIAADRGVVLACGAFEADADMQRQHWQIKPVFSAAARGNTGDGIRMAQAAGAGLWHMWHFHGSYGFRHPDPAYPFGIRLKRLPDWTPGRPQRDDVRMSWILLDRTGRRFMNEYDPYLQDTGHRLLEQFDPITQSHPRIPATLVLDAAGRRQYSLCAPTWHDREVAARFAGEPATAWDDRILVRADSPDELAVAFALPAGALRETVAAWNVACAAGKDAQFSRPPGSMMPIVEGPYFGAKVWPIVSNTQGGPVHDERQRVLDAFGRPIPRLFVAGELGSVFGHLYMSGGNLAECFIGGRIAGLGAAA